MGMVFGKQTVSEPAYKSLLNRTIDADVKTTYEIRKYGERFAAEVSYAGHNGETDDTSSPFRALAQYIGVFGDAQNDGGQSMAMTAPVVIEDDDNKNNNVDKKSNAVGGTKMAMTAPVVITAESSTSSSSSSSSSDRPTNANNDNSNRKRMKFILPAEYDDMSKIPKPLNPNVHIEAIPPQVGAVHRYNGDRDDEHNKAVARNLAEQLAADGVEGMTTEFALQHYQFWGFNPPFTIPYFRRNEIWIELTSEQADALVAKYGT